MTTTRVLQPNSTTKIDNQYAHLYKKDGDYYYVVTTSSGEKIICPRGSTRAKAYAVALAYIKNRRK